MRALGQPRLLLVSLPLGVGLALSCVPLILAEGGDGLARVLQLLTLPLLCVLFIQAVLAWTPTQARVLPPRGGSRLVWRGSELLLLAVAMAGCRMLADGWLRQALVLPEVDDWRTFFRVLPFTGLVQPLFLVLGVYAFAVRLSRRTHLALVTVVLVHQAVVLLQFGSLASGGVLAAVVVFAGVQGLVMGGSYLRYGLAGPVALSVLGYGRHGLYLLFPVLRGVAVA
jgi:hypothetical protein